MGLVLVTPPAAEPLNLADVKGFGRIEHDLEDSLLERLMISVRQRAEQLTRNQLITATWKLELDEFCPVIRVPIAPLVSVTQIQYIDNAGALQTVSAADYQVETGGRRPGVTGEIVPAYGKAWPSARPERGAVRVTFNAGWGDNPESIPGAIMDWMMIQVLTRYENRQLLEAGAVEELRFVDALLDPYKVRIVP